MLRLELEAVAGSESHPYELKRGALVNTGMPLIEASVAEKYYHPEAVLSLSFTLLILSSID